MRYLFCDFYYLFNDSMNLKKLFAGLATIAVVATSLAVAVPSVNGQLNDPEFTAALDWAYSNGLTKYNNEDAFNPYGALSREAFAKFASAYAVSNLCLEADTSASCTFSDESTGDYTLVDHVTLACQLGLVKGSNGKFMYANSVTKAEVLTVLSRAISAAAGETAPAETATPWYANHFNAMRALGVTKETDVNAVNKVVSRYEVLLMLYRSRVEDAACGDNGTDITDLLEDLFGDDDTTTTDDDTTTTDDDTTTDVVTSSDGKVMASVSPSTPSGDTIPGNAALVVFSMDFTADADDVVLSAVELERFGLGSDDVIDEVTLSVNNEVVSKSRSFNSSDQTANLSLNPSVTVPAGTTVTVDVIATIGDVDADDISNEEFQIGLVNFETNGDEDMSNLPVKGNEFEVAGVNGAEITVSADGNISDVELGDMGVEVAKFEIENDWDDAVYITTITLEDDSKDAEDNLENFVLEVNGDIIATTTATNGKYLTFTIDDADGYMVDENETEDFKVLADVVEGAGDEIAFGIDEKIYVRGYDERFGYGLSVTLNYPFEAFTINAWEVTLVEAALAVDEIRDDRDDVILAEFDIRINAGQELSLEDIAFDVDLVGADTLGAPLEDHFDDIELVVVIDGSRRTYDLDINDDGTGFDAEDDDLSIFLPETGDVTVILEADTINTFPTASVDGNDEFRVTLDINCTTNSCTGLEIIENDDDEVVTDLVPTSITFDTLRFVETEIEVNGISLTNVDVVKGSVNVDAVMFEVETDDVSSASVEGFVFDGTSTAGLTFGQDLVTALRLWKKTASGWELLEEQGGFDIETSGEITFDDFDDIIVPVSSTQLFLLTVDVTDSDAAAAPVESEFSVSLVAADIDDDDNKSLLGLTDTLTVASNRTIRVTGAGELSITVDNSDNETDEPKFVLAGSTEAASEFVASFELVATNEGIDIEDAILHATFAGGSFVNAVMEVVVYDDDKTTELFREVINTTNVASPLEIDMNNINLVIDEGSTNIYVKVVTEPIGDNQNGDEVVDATFSLEVAEVDGVDSGDDVAVTYDAAGQTLPSLEFDVIPVRISDVEMVTSYGSNYSVDTNVSGTQTDIYLGIIKVTADTWANTNNTDGSELNILMDTIRVESTAPAALVTNYSIERVDISNGTEIPGVDTAGIVEFPLTTGTTSDREIESGEVAYFLVRWDIATIGDDANFRINLDNLDGATNNAFVYSTDDATLGSIDELRLGTDERNGVSIDYDDGNS